MKSDQCKKCEKEIIWAVNPNTGAKIPLDAKALVFEITEFRDGRIEAVPVNKSADYVNRTGYFVTHFATCQHAAEFSGKPRSEQSAPSGEDANAVALEFIKDLDSTEGVELSEFEAAFVASVLERAVKYRGDVRFTDKQLGVVGRMKKKYKVRPATNTQSTDTKQAKKLAEVHRPEQSEMLEQSKDGDGNIPF